MLSHNQKQGVSYTFDQTTSILENSKISLYIPELNSKPFSVNGEEVVGGKNKVFPLGLLGSLQSRNFLVQGKPIE
jgi:hypothetical protein